MSQLIAKLWASLTGAKPKTKNLESVSPDELRRERIRVEQSEQKVSREIAELEKQKDEYFRKGVQDASERQRIQIARKIKQLDGMIKAKDRQLALLNKNIRVLSSVAQLKENQRMLEDLGMDSIVNQMDLEEVQSFVEKATVEGQFQMERFTSLLESVDDAESVFEDEELDADTQSILELMAAASSDGTDESIRAGLAQMDDALRPEPAERTSESV